jgi:putative hydrolase of HD superfamily
MAYLVKDEFPEADIDKVILICICHDLWEANKAGGKR